MMEVFQFPVALTFFISTARSKNVKKLSCKVLTLLYSKLIKWNNYNSIFVYVPGAVDEVYLLKSTSTSQLFKVLAKTINTCIDIVFGITVVTNGFTKYFGVKNQIVYFKNWKVLQNVRTFLPCEKKLNKILVTWKRKKTSKK